jgi:hypothetical protein
MHTAAGVKHLVYRELGTLDLTCQILIDPTQSHSLLVYAPEPGTDSHEKPASTRRPGSTCGGRSRVLLRVAQRCC